MQKSKNAKENSIQQSNTFNSKPLDKKANDYKPIILAIIVLLSIGISILYIFTYDFNKSHTIQNFPEIVIGFTKTSASVIIIMAWIITLLAFIIESAKFVYSKFKKSDSERNIKALSFLSSIVLLSSLLMFIRSQNINAKALLDNLRLDKLFNITSKSDFIVIPLVLIISIALILVIIVIVKTMFNIIFSVNNKEYDIIFTEIKDIIVKVLKKIFEISHKTFSIVLGLIEKPLAFIEFVPDFFDELKNLIHNPKDAKEINILKKSSFCFAIVSFVTTAYGYENCVFDNYWEALVVSFAIQATLFILGLKLPEILHKFKQTKTLKTKKNRAFTFFLISTYVFVLFSSSLFSFFYIAKFSYTGTRYLNSNIELENKCLATTINTEKHIKKQIDTLMNIIAKKATELNNSNPRQPNSEAKSETDIEYLEILKKQQQKDLDGANDDYAEKEASYKQYLSQDHERIADFYEELEKKRIVAQIAKDYRDECENNYKNTLLQIAQANKTESQSFDAQMQALLTEILKKEPGTNELNEILDNLIKIFEGNKTDLYIINAENADNFTTLRQSVQNYVELKKLLSCTETDKASIETIKAKLSVPIITPEKDDKEHESDIIAWRKEWTNRINDIKSIVSSIPDISYNESDTAEDFEPAQIIKILNDLSRENLADINLIEHAVILVNSEYNVLAISSIVIAFFMDLAALFSSVSIFFIEKYKIFNDETPADDK